MSNVTSIRTKFADPGNADAVSVFLANSLRRPLTIQIDTAKIRQLARHSEDPINQLSHEMLLWRQALGARDVACVELRYREEELAPYDVTRLMHCLASEFNIVSSQSRVIFPCANVEQASLALLKGLGFASALIETKNSDGQTLRALSNLIGYMRSLQFGSIGLQITRSSNVEELTHIIRLLQQSLSPDYVFIGSSTYKLISAEKSDNRGQSALLEKHTAHCPTIFEDDVYETYCDHIKLGPDSESPIQGRRFNTLTNALKYQDAICHQRLPLVQISTANTKKID